MEEFSPLLIIFVVIFLLVLVISTTKSQNHEDTQNLNPKQHTKHQQKSASTQNRLDIHEHPEVKVQRVIDGDTVVVIYNRQQVKIRLDAIDCPEDGQEWGDIATYGLIKLIGGKTIRMEIHSTDIYNRTVATLYVQQKYEADWINVNEKMVTLGHAWVMRRYYQHLPKERQNRLNDLERWAKSKKIGLWKTQSPTPPWQWRNNVNKAKI